MRAPIDAVNRRAWLAALAAGWAGLSARGEPPRPADDDDRRAVEARAKQVGLGPLRVGRTAHYLGIGDAPDAFRALALEACEAVARDYLEHFRKKDFQVDLPAQRLTVVILADAEAFATFLGTEPGQAVGGLYDLDTNRLVVFAFQGAGEAAGQANRVSLVHEATHQLTFNTGLLDRRADVPVAISEGLATYGEVRPRLTGRSMPGQKNLGRLEGLALARRQGLAWIPISRLLVEDALFADAETQQLAYAEGWLLVDYLLKTPTQLPKFRAYLVALRARRDPDHRLDDARSHLGDLDRLDRAVAHHASRLSRS